ncbi:hypothetical protein EDD85DRAFT_988135 [Armillaria nabsnona]|nr:hypothetical protein EDD85DRAFT_988135 [Armillaria nabsnona]
MNRKKQRPRLPKKANINVQTFTVAPSTFTAITGSPTKGSSSSKIHIDPVLKRPWDEETPAATGSELDFNSNFTDIDPSSSKRPQLVEMMEDIDANAEEKAQSKWEQTFKEGVSKSMNQFRPKFPMILDYILASKSNVTIGQPCSCGEADSLCECLCNDCQHFEPSCRQCFIKPHLGNPWHWAEVWNSKFFERQDISELGHIVTIGHDRHEALHCPYGAVKDPLEFHLIHTNGVHKTKVYFCRCPLTWRDRMESCLQSRIFPGTVAEPCSGFTFAVLQDFHLQTLTSKKSAYDYIFTIRRKTNNAFSKRVPDIYPLFLCVQHIWISLTMFKQSSQVHGVDQHFPSRPAGSVAVPCFSCPERGFNVSDTVMDTITDEYQHLVQLFLMQDGHFGLQRFQKVDDPDDVSLIPGAGFFPRDSDYLPYERDVIATSDEKLTCSNFNALEMQNKLKFRGCVITGVIAVECGRHCVFLSMVDLRKGERFANGDYTLAMALRRYTQGHSLTGAKYFRRIVLTYDVACQYQANLQKCFNTSFLDIADIIDIIICLVPKMHLDGHIECCKYEYSLNYVKGMGQSHGEGIEPSWAETKQLGGSTRQMNHGHRHDKLNDFHNFWNWLKAEHMCDYLSEHLSKAWAKVQEMVEFLLGLSLVHGEELVTCWEKQYEECVPYMVSEKDKKDWSSPYRMTLQKLPMQSEVLISLTKHKDACTMDKLVKEEHKNDADRLCIIDNGIKLQIRQRELKSIITKNETPADDIKKMRKALASDIKKFHKQQIKVLPLLDSAEYDLAENTEDDILLLPSDFNIADHQTYGLKNLVITEYKLCEGQANDAIAMLCTGIIHGMVLNDSRRKHS